MAGPFFATLMASLQTADEATFARCRASRLVRDREPAGCIAHRRFAADLDRRACDLSTPAHGFRSPDREWKARPGRAKAASGGRGSVETPRLVACGRRLAAACWFARAAGPVAGGAGRPR